MTILREEVLAVVNRKGEYETAEAYYDGNVPEVFGSHRMARIFRGSSYSHRLNFCRPIVDAVLHRLELAAVQGVSDQANQIIGDTWEWNQLGLDANEIHRRAEVFGNCYVMVWPDEDGNLEISYNSPLTTAIIYDAESPRTKVKAVKMWEEGENTRLNVYTPDRIVKYVAKGRAVSEGADWTQIDEVDNPFGEVPVFHFRTLRPFGRPEHRDAYDIQDYINKQFVTSMVVTDYQGAPQRYALTRENSEGDADDFVEGDTERENRGSFKNGPGELWYLEGVEKVGEFKPADPENFWKPIREAVRSMASISNTPLHYFERTGNVPSGEALRVAEAPLIKKVTDRQASFGQTWREIFKFVLKVNGLDEDVQVKWKDIESLDALEVLDAALKKRNVGMSIKQVLTEMGYDSEVADRVIEEARAERETGDASDYPRVRTQENNDERNIENKENE